MADLGPGIWQLSETQLAASTIPSSSRELPSLCSAQHRNARVLHGAPAPVRATSSVAGSLTGVLTCSDWPCRELPFFWNNGAYHTGRVQAIPHFLGNFCLTTANVYGFAQGYTFPDARARTDQLLAEVTREIVLGCKGFRAISGDMNHDARTLEQISIWERLGWAEVQTLAHAWWQIEPRNTWQTCHPPRFHLPFA